MIKVNGFTLHSPGDPSVGIFSTTHTISGPFYFENDEELLEFKKSLSSTFELYGDDFRITTFEEDQEREKLYGREDENEEDSPIPWDGGTL